MSETQKNTEETQQDKRMEGESDEELKNQQQQQQEKPNRATSQTAPQPREVSSRHISFPVFEKLKNFIVAPMQSQPRSWRGEERDPIRRGQNQQPPKPPSYYSNIYGYQYTTIPQSIPRAGVMGQQQLAFFQNPIMDFSYWAPYPPDIPEGIPPGLAHLISADCIIVMQQINMIQLFIDVTQTCTFMVLNSEGLCIFYAYETSEFCTRYCCGNNRPLQIHVKDMYQNEIIYMNRLCSCNDYCSACCCLTALEVYSVPLLPIGAVIQRCYLTHVQFDIVDVDENVIFKIRGPPYCRLSGCCYEAEFTIHALDPARTEIGLIRKQWGGFFREMLSTADVFTINFPKDLDVKIKAIFLGAMFLIRLKRTGWVLRNVEDPETVSGHMYRMSIMAFLIPEAEGVDKTRCMKLSLVHDLAECIVGDLTPFCGVEPSEKHRREDAAMKKLTQLIGDSGSEIYNLFKEYEAQITEESKLVKDLDRLDMILQAYEYEKLSNKPGKLEEFFASTVNKFHYPWTIDIVKELYRQRNIHKEENKV